MSRVPPMPCIAHRVPECPACKAGNNAQGAREPVAWRFKERINGEFDSDWILTKSEPADGVRILAKEPLYTAAGVPAAPVPSAEKRQQAREVAAIFRAFSKSSHRFHDGRPLHEVAAELLEAFATDGVTAAPAPEVQQALETLATALRMQRNNIGTTDEEDIQFHDALLTVHRACGVQPSQEGQP